MATMTIRRRERFSRSPSRAERPSRQPGGVVGQRSELRSACRAAGGTGVVCQSKAPFARRARIDRTRD